MSRSVQNIRLAVASFFLLIIQVASASPNIVFILADDLGWQDVGFMGSRWFETPNLDRLAGESAVFTQATMYPTCSPSRTALATGRHSFRTGVYTVPPLEKGDPEFNIYSRWTIGKEHPFYSEVLNTAGYKLIHLGKWHLVGPYPVREKSYPFPQRLTAPPNGNFDWVAAHRTPEIQQYYPQGRGYHENVGGTFWGDPARGYANGYRSDSGGYRAPFKNPFIVDKPKDEWLTDRLTDDAIDFIDRNQKEPFFVNLHYYAPHRPTVSRSDEALEHFMNKPADEVTGQGFENRAEIAAYATMVQALDDNIGRILSALDERGLRENTIVVFTSDNGFNGVQSCCRALRGCKGWVYEGGLRVPALVHWRGKVEASVIDTPVQTIDWFPTFLDMAGIRDQYTGQLDGDSLMPLLYGKPMKERALYWHIASNFKSPACSVIRQDDWKLIQYLATGALELYNLKDDPAETQNRVLRDADTASDLLEQLVEWRKSNNVPLPPVSNLAY